MHAQCPQSVYELGQLFKMPLGWVVNSGRDAARKRSITDRGSHQQGGYAPGSALTLLGIGEGRSAGAVPEYIGGKVRSCCGLLALLGVRAPGPVVALCMLARGSSVGEPLRWYRKNNN